MKRIVPGIHSVTEVFRVRPKAITELWLREGDLRDDLNVFYLEAQKKHIKVKRVSQAGLDRQVATHQGVIAFVDGGPPWPTGRELNGFKEGLILALDHIEDPHNVGSIMRSAWNLGVLGVILTKDRSAGLAPSAQKVASGAFEHVPITEVANLHAELKALQDAGFWVYGLDESATQAIHEVEFAPKSILVIGSEEMGLRKPTLSACDATLAIPQSEGSNSFNAAVAGAIAGYEFLRQRNLSINPKNSRKKL
ncbi:MAG: RNA methyltransferase [Oligoflexia bacterium]|nr:RNA methyltransferase [Oligoflexia bacterium]